MKRAIFSSLLVALAITLFAQVEKSVVVEHFTNTRCGICASKNPGFYQNLADHPNILHLAIHPSSPYSNCALHLDNPTENDGRTNFYNVYGGTPRLVIQGEPQSLSINMSSPSIFDPYEGQTSPVMLKIKEYRIGTDSVRAEVTIKAVAAHSLSTAGLFLAYAEDTVFYVAPNGENEHYDVFRKAFTPVDGSNITLPAQGDSVVMNYTIAMDAGWNPVRMFALAVLQDMTTKEVIQSGKTSSVEFLSSIFSRENESRGKLNTYPNPATHEITVRNVSGPVEIYTLEGRSLIRKDAGNTPADLTIKISGLQKGTYLISNQGTTSLFIKQ